MESSILTLLIFVPVAGAVLMLFFAMLYGKENAHYYKWIAAITTGIQLVLAGILYLNFDPALSVTESPFTVQLDRKSTRLNSSHALISYAVFCLKKKKKQTKT